MLINFLLCTGQLCHNRMISRRKTYIYSVWDDMMCFWINNPKWHDAEWYMGLPLPGGSSFTWWSEEFSWKAIRTWSEFFWDWDFGAFWLWEFLIRGVYLMNCRQNILRSTELKSVTRISRKECTACSWVSKAAYQQCLMLLATWQVFFVKFSSECMLLLSLRI